jgi:ABC-type uncharacterized transport system substrate-binding protein
MNRRAFLGTLADGLLAVPLAAEAQEPKVYRVGVLLQGSPPPPGSKPGPLRRVLQELGYIVGRNLVLEVRWAEGKNQRFPDLAVELVALKPDVIIADSTPAAIAAARSTTTVPIVMMNVSDPVGSGLIASLAHPGGNVTGAIDFSNEVITKQLELLHTAAPRATRIAVLMLDNPVHPAQLGAAQNVAKSMGVTVVPTKIRSSEDFQPAFVSMTKKAEALLLLGGAPFSTDAQVDRIVELAMKAKMPAVYPSHLFVDRGGLLSYGTSSLYRGKQMAAYVDKILKGSKPADLPVQQPTEFELVINLKTAKALGLTIPPSLLQRADQVIE